MHGADVLVAIRFRLPDTGAADFLDRAQTALRALAAMPGYVDGGVGRATEDPTLWLMSLRWE
ncbi:MAG: antibiotic biosynthesis monooxygenase family protein, partial [Nocardioidaceae bacterium]